MLRGEGSRLPVHCGKPSGNIPEVKTIANLMQDIDFRETGDLNLLLDRGFRSEKNLNGLMQRHHQFLTAVRTSLKPVGGRLNEDRKDCITGGNYNSGPRLDVRSYAESRDYTGRKPRQGETVADKRRVCIHIYFNDQHCTDDRKPNHESVYGKYCVIHGTPVRGGKISRSAEAIRRAEQDYGYFALLSKGIKDPVAALEIYRLRDLIGKSCGSLKDQLSLRRMSVSSDENFEGRLCVRFAAMEIMAYIRKKMADHDLYRNYTLQAFPDKTDTIEYCQQPGRAHRPRGDHGEAARAVWLDGR